MNKIVVFEGFLLCEEVDVENLKKVKTFGSFFQLFKKWNNSKKESLFFDYPKKKVMGT
jgi:hypothetical protein